MTEKITLELTKEEFYALDRNIMMVEETESILEKIKEGYKQLEEQQEPQMTLKKSGDCDVISYDHKYYYRLSFGVGDFYWYKRYVGSSNLMRVEDPEEHRLLEELYDGIILDTGGVVEPEKRKIDDLAEKLLPDDHPYKIADEHGETNPYKQYLNSVEDEKKMEKLGFVKNSDGSWTAQPLGETAQERGERVHKEMEETIKIHDGYGVVDVKTNWKPKPQTPEQVADGLKKAFREAIKQRIIPEVDKVSDEFMDEMVAKLKGQTLRDVCMEWWSDVFTTEYDWDDETSIQDLISRIEEWLPKPQNSAGSQNAYVESAVEGFNDCLDTIKRKLR